MSIFIVRSQNHESDSLKIVLKKATTDTARCRILNVMIEGEFDDLIWPKYNDELKRISEKNIKTGIGDISIFQRHLAGAFNNEGYLANERGHFDEALEKYFKSLKLLQALDSKNDVATTFNNIAFAYQNKGLISKALFFYDKSTRLYQELGNLKGVARVQNNCALIFDDQGDIPKALEYYHKSLKTREAINDKAGAGACLNNIATIYHHLGNLDKAIEYYSKGLKKQIEINDVVGIANSQNNIGAIYESKAALYDLTKKGHIADSLLQLGLNNFRQSLSIFQQYQSKGGEANTLSKIGSVYNKQANLLSDADIKKKDSLLDLALAIHNKCLEIRTEIKDKRGVAYSLYNLATIFNSKKEYPLAITNAENSLKLSKELGFPDILQLTSLLLSKLYAHTHNYKNAFEMHQLYKQMSDSLNNQAARKASIQKSFQYIYDKKAAADSVKVADERNFFSIQMKQERIQRFALYGGLALVLIFSAFMVNRFVVTNRQKKIIEHKEKEALVQNMVITEQKALVEEKQKEMLDSIHYAKRIQTALIANSTFIDKHIPNNFIYFDPKDIVSGDFYWATAHKNKFYLAICDSTGHGVPGAFMSLLNMGFLSEAIKEKNIEKPNEIFNYVRERLISSISSEGQKDGMDGILLCLDKKTNTMEYCAANNEPVLIHNNSIIELPKDKMPVGKGERQEEFKLHSIDLKPGDTLYLYTDGFADQFGGPKGKKFKYKQLNELLLSLNTVPLNEQKQILEQTFKTWKGNLEQVDDVLIAGIKI
ncbi:MAG: tetratricopeptide repeat protein [Sphingobacteriaceae bacterium]|nr:tetratricopeptide repeat protein [Sphingobacteriaceae bacterium]